MALFIRLARLTRSLFQKRRREEDLDHELRAYVELLTDEKIRAGMSPKEARRSALIDTGGVELVKEQCRDIRAFAWLGSLWQDTRYAVRGLWKSPGFTLVAMLSLALGIGANATIFSAFYGVLLRPLPYQNPDSLFSVGRVGEGERGGSVMTPELVAWRVGNRVFEGLAAWDDSQLNLTGAGTPERIGVATVTSNLLDVLGVQTAIGRGFIDDDGKPGAPAVVLLTPEFWRRHFGSDPTVVGRIVMLNDEPTTVLGVLPITFRFPGEFRPDALGVSRLANQPEWDARRVEGFHGIARLRAGLSTTQAASDLAAITAAVASPGFVASFAKKDTRVEVVSLQEQLIGDRRVVLRMLLGAVGLLLLIACANVANLQLGRAAFRRREIGLRAALGASRARLARLLVIENLVLAVFAGLAGVVVASILVDLLMLSPGLPLRNPGDLRVGWVVGSVTFALSTVAGLGIGLAPAVLASRLDLNEVLKSGALSVMGGRGAWVRSALVLSQVALALVLLLGSGLLLRSLQGVLAVDPGFRPERLLTAGVRLPGSRYKQNSQQHAFVQSLIERVSGLPGVETVAVTNGLPLAGYSFLGSLRTEGQPVPERGQEAHVPAISVSTEYFRTMGIPLQAGRNFGSQDAANEPLVAIANIQFAQRFFHSTNVVGKQVQFFQLGGNAPWTTIVGVVGNVRQNGSERPAASELYVPELQMPGTNLRIAIRTKGPPLSLGSSLRSAVWSIDKDLPVNDIVTMEERMSKSSAARTLQTLLLTSFAVLALVLAAVGIYGVVSEMVVRRTREIGLRMALGAQAPDVLGMVMRRSLVLGIAGITVGCGAGLFLSKYLASLLFGVKATDASTFAASALALLGVALLAGFLPARRASRIDPVNALRCD